jgi:hypothetical protein
VLDGVLACLLEEETATTWENETAVATMMVAMGTLPSQHQHLHLHHHRLSKNCKCCAVLSAQTAVLVKATCRPVYDSRDF